MTKKKAHKPGSATIALNKRARHEYFIEEEFEAGLALQGWEVKSCAQEKPISATATSFCVTERHFCLALTSRQWLWPPRMWCAILPVPASYFSTSANWTHCTVASIEGYTVVALSLYWKNAWCKVKIGVAKGKKQHDKRSDIKEREWQVDKARIMKNAHR